MFILQSCTYVKYVSCNEDYTNKVKGASKESIISEFGVPDRTYYINKDSYVLVYEKFSVTTTTNSYGSSFSSANAYSTRNSTYANANTNMYAQQNTHSTENRTYIEFYMNKYNKCYSVKTSDTKPVYYKDKKATGWLLGGSIGGGLLLVLLCLLPVL